jgi:hypothetical protein
MLKKNQHPLDMCVYNKGKPGWSKPKTIVKEDDQASTNVKMCDDDRHAEMTRNA